MFSKLFAKKSDHPLADIKSVQLLLEDLPRNDPHKLVMEVADWIDSVVANPEFKLDYQFTVLRLLDETAQPYVRKLMRSYFTSNELNAFQENRLWLVLGSYFRQISTAYLAIFKGYCARDQGSDAIKKHVSLLAERTLNAIAGQLKFACAHYGPVARLLWSDISSIYKHAEQQQYLDTECDLYAGVVGKTTLKMEFGRLIAWYGCGVKSLSPQGMHLTERLIDHCKSNIEISASVTEHSLFNIDLDRPAAPMRIQVDATTHAQMRFVSMWGVKSKLEGLIQVLDKGIVPEELHLMGAYDADMVRETTRYLLNYIVSPPLRRHKRRNIKVKFNVVNSFSRVVECTDVGLNFNSEAPMCWHIDDISVDGFRTVLPAQKSGGIYIGSLFGVQPDGMDDQWGVAVVRRMARDADNQLHVGAEILSNHIVGVSLSLSGGGGGGYEDGQVALWLLPMQEEVSGEAQLVMKVDTFSMNRSLQTEMNGKRYLLIPHSLINKGRDYDLAQFRVVEQESSSEVAQ